MIMYRRVYTDYFPSSGNIRFMEIAFQEYLGMLWAKIGGNWEAWENEKLGEEANFSDGNKMVVGL